MLKKIIAAMLDEMFHLGLDIIGEAEYFYGYTCADGEVCPKYWDVYEWGDGLMDTAIELGDKIGYNTNDTMWEDEIEYISQSSFVSKSRTPL